MTPEEEARWVGLIREVRAIGVSWDCIDRTMDAIQADDTLGALRKFRARSRRPADRMAYQHAIDIQLRKEKP